MALAAFGSLNGRIEVFDMQSKNFNLVGKCTSACSSFLKWSSDCRRFLTAIVVDKLKVDHSFKIHNYTGEVLKSVKLKIFDLINVDFVFDKRVEEKLEVKIL